MGIEYRISCSPERLPEMDAFLRRAGGQPCARFPEQREFRFDSGHPDAMPDAVAMVEAQGVYFRDNGGAPEKVAVLFRAIVDEALALSGDSDHTVVTHL